MRAQYGETPNGWDLKGQRHLQGLETFKIWEEGFWWIFIGLSENV